MSLYSIPPLLTLLCYVGLGWLVLHRGLTAPVNKLLFMICLAGTLLYLDILIIFNITSPVAALITSRVDHCCVVFTIPLFVHFFRVYLKGDIARKRPWYYISKKMERAKLVQYLKLIVGAIQSRTQLEFTLNNTQGDITAVKAISR